MVRRPVKAYVNELLQAIETIDPMEIEYSFDEFSDTFYVSVLPQPQPGVSMVLHDGWMIRVHCDTDQVIGLQIENMVSRTLNQFPELSVLMSDQLTEHRLDDPVYVDQSVEALTRFKEYVPRIAGVGV